MSAFAPKDRPLIERVYEKNEATLRKFVFHRLKDEEKTKDVIQEVAINFMEAFDSLTYLSERSLRSYLYRMTLYTVLDLQRQTNHEIPITEIEENDFVFDVEEFVFGQHGALILKEKIKQLPPRYAMYIEMAYLDKCPQKSIAAALKVKESSLRSIASRARKMLAKLCNEDNEVHE